MATLVYGSGCNITTDNFFTSHSLAKFLLGQNLTLLGTVRKTRKELPSEFVLNIPNLRPPTGGTPHHGLKGALKEPYR